MAISASPSPLCGPISLSQTRAYVRYCKKQTNRLELKSWQNHRQDYWKTKEARYSHASGFWELRVSNGADKIDTGLERCLSGFRGCCRFLTNFWNPQNNVWLQNDRKRVSQSTETSKSLFGRQPEEWGKCQTVCKPVGHKRTETFFRNPQRGVYMVPKTSFPTQIW